MSFDAAARSFDADRYRIDSKFFFVAFFKTSELEPT